MQLLTTPFSHRYAIHSRHQRPWRLARRPLRLHQDPRPRLHHRPHAGRLHHIPHVDRHRHPNAAAAPVRRDCSPRVDGTICALGRWHCLQLCGDVGVHCSKRLVVMLTIIVSCSCSRRSWSSLKIKAQTQPLRPLTFRKHDPSSIAPTCSFNHLRNGDRRPSLSGAGNTSSQREDLCKSL